MALKHFKRYYAQVQEQYFEMLEDTKDFNILLKEGQVTQEQVEQAQQMLAKIKENYERLAYVALLLSKPNRKSKEKAYKRQNKAVYSALEEASDDYVIAENADCLKEFKEYIKKCKSEVKDG